MARKQAPAIGGAEATLKRIDYIEEEAENIQFAIWANRPLSARKMLKGLSKEVEEAEGQIMDLYRACLLYTSPSPRDATLSRMPSSA